MATGQDAKQFEQFINLLHPMGVRASIVDEKQQQVGPWFGVDLHTVSVLSARESDDADEVFFAVELARQPLPDPAEGSLVVYITDPAVSPEPGVHLFPMRSSKGAPDGDIFLMLTDTPLETTP